MSFAALATPAVSFRDASKDPAIDVLAKFVFVGGALWASAFAMGLMYGLIKTRAYPILNEQATSLIRENTRLGDAEMRVFYSTALNELNNNIPDAGLWAQCLAKTKGNEPAAKAKYLETRARELAKLATAQAREATQTPQTI
jgi:hypothetical protein